MLPDIPHRAGEIIHLRYCKRCRRYLRPEHTHEDEPITEVKLWSVAEMLRPIAESR